MSNEKIQLGDTIRDRVSGLTGIAVARIVFLSGCIRYMLSPKADDNKAQDERWFDIEQVELVEAGTVSLTPRPTGGDDNPPPHSKTMR